MAAMDGMTMPGGWTMSMAWMRMPGQSWLDAATSFVAMWAVMMVPMMLPSVAPMLWRYRRAIRAVSAARSAALTMLVGGAYFAVWVALGVVVYGLGVAFAWIAMHQPPVARAVPLMAGLLVTVAGALQFTTWKAERLACCGRFDPLIPNMPANAITALRRGGSLALHCIECCAALMSVPLVLGVMDLGVMIVVTLAITAERLAPVGARVARVIGTGVVAWGAFLTASAVVGLD